MTRAALALVLSLAGAGTATAEPSADELEAHAVALRDRLKRDGMTVVVEPPFVVVGDNAGIVRRRSAGILRWAISRYEADLFETGPSRIVEIWLFRNEKTYRRGAMKYFGDEPSTPYGYYSPEDSAIIMNIGPGAGTLTHEVVHPYVEADFPAAPSWLNEGIASLYEYPTDVRGHIAGKVNWRLPGLQRAIRARTLPALPVLLSTTTDEFYGAEYDSYAFARFLMQHLQEEGKLFEFYARFRAAAADDPTGEATLAAVLGEDLATYEARWRKWVMTLRK